MDGVGKAGHDLFSTMYKKDHKDSFYTSWIVIQWNPVNPVTRGPEKYGLKKLAVITKWTEGAVQLYLRTITATFIVQDKLMKQK